MGRSRTKKAQQVRIPPTEEYPDPPIPSLSLPELPFKIEDVVKNGLNPSLFMDQVSEEVWEYSVCQRLIELRGKSSIQRKGETGGFSLRSIENADETGLAEEYERRLKTSRLHVGIAQALLEDTAGNRKGMGWHFEEIWKLLSAAHKERMVLAALAFATREVDEIWVRTSTPDLSPQQLLYGDNFLDILRQIVRSGVKHANKMDDYEPINSDRWDSTQGIDRNSPGDVSSRSERLIVSYYDHRRNFYIALVVSAILDLLQIVGSRDRVLFFLSKPRLGTHHPERIRGGTLTSTSDYFEAKARLMREASNGQLLNDHERKFLDQMVANLKEGVEIHPVCRACGRFADEVKELVEAGNRALSFCSRCFGVGRKMSYCSVDCQKEDFKRGGHKMICGKRLQDVPELFASSFAVHRPEPLASIALQKQLYLVAKQSQCSSTSYIYSLFFESNMLQGVSKIKPEDRVLVRSRGNLQHLLEQALQTQKESDIKEFVVAVVSTGYPEERRYAATECIELAKQFGREWRIPVETMARWVWNGFESHADKLTEEMEQRKTRSCASEDV